MGNWARKWFENTGGNSHRAAYLKEETDQAVIVIATAFAVSIALIYVDYQVLGPGKWLVGSILARGLFGVCSIAVIARFKRRANVEDRDRILFLWSLLAAIFVLGANLTRFGNASDRTFSIWFILGNYFLLPNRAILKIIPALGFSIADAAILLFFTEGMSPPALVTSMVSLIAANAAGILLSVRLENSQRKRHQARILEERNRLQLIELATTDSLTGIFNRRRFIELGETEFNRYKRYGNTFSFIVFDINKFKSINDTYGHPAGDIVLQEFCALLTAMKRSIDIVGRLGGDEIGLILPGTNYKNARAAIQRINQACGKLVIRIFNHRLHISFSAGVAEVQPSDKSIDDLYRRADKRLYANKRKRTK
jgi:diguanylate cyclase (GGDEF)-like protein